MDFAEPTNQAMSIDGPELVQHDEAILALKPYGNTEWVGMN